MRILVAEDDATTRRMIELILGKSGHEALSVADGLEAWKHLTAPDAPRLAVLDWMMPGMDGVEVCRRLRAERSDQLVYLILLTARVAKSDVVEGLEAGADDYLTKPFNANELRARVQVGERVVDLQSALGERVRALEEALGQIKTLRGLLPICAYCKKIRDDKGYWNQVEDYVRLHTQADFSHSLCPDCLEKYYGPCEDDDIAPAGGGEGA